MITNQDVVSAVQRRVERRRTLLEQMARKDPQSPRYQTLWSQYQEVEQDLQQIRILVREA